jgi:hypothetical protein
MQLACNSIGLGHAQFKQIYSLPSKKNCAERNPPLFHFSINITQILMNCQRTLIILHATLLLLLPQTIVSVMIKHERILI